MKVLITDRFETEALTLLQGQLPTTLSQAPQPTAEELSTAEILIIRSRTKIHDSLLQQAPKLRAIITATSGFDHIDLVATSAHKIPVMFTPDANAASACELTWALLLSCARRLNEAQRALSSGDWKREALIGRELCGKTLGIVGLGRIGSRVARAAQAFGMNLIAYDPYKAEDAFNDVNPTRVDFEELLKIADVVSFHVPASPQTKGMLTLRRLELMKRSSIFVNVSRGSIVTERDLVHALTEKWIAGAALDVFEQEPLSKESKLLSFPQVVMSPHLGATTSEAFTAASLDAAEKALAFAASGAVSDPLPPKEAWYQAGFGKGD